jgi:CRISPR/Cas system CMR-associated protein Cmr5 small subunit
MAIIKRYECNDNELKRVEAKWIPGYEGRYAYSVEKNAFYYVAFTNRLYTKSYESRNGNQIKWRVIINGVSTTFTSSQLRDLMNGVKAITPVPEKYVSIENDSYLVGKVIRDEKSNRDRVEIIASNLDSSTARETAKALTVKNLCKYVVLSVDAVVTFKVLPEVSV